ncbi:hypothetical protein [Halothece sp. PCC 7418]|uniref:hypothetical protein n=1 Tax=Halothece sp. (strain PCC 7418) TaxID=65093 RepID=UPI00123753A9|nr:hypothetical protein [Halothece sp. PCC 7418]
MTLRTDQCHPPPLTLRWQDNKLNYRSAIALFLARKHSSLASQVAAAITEKLQETIPPDFADIRCSPPAWIEFTLTEKTIQNWLEEGLQGISSLSYSLTPPETIDSFPKYVRDRCWQLLQLGIQENFISLLHPIQQWKTISFSTPSLLIDEDWQFLYQLILTRDGLEKVSSVQQREKLADHLSAAFLEFHRHCQLFNRQQPHFHQLAVIRFTAIAITERLLFDLED